MQGEESAELPAMGRAGGRRERPVATATRRRPRLERRSGPRSAASDLAAKADIAQHCRCAADGRLHKPTSNASAASWLLELLACPIGAPASCKF